MGSKKNKIKGKNRANQSNRLNLPSHQTNKVNYDKEHPHFSFRYLQGNYCLTKCDENHQASFARKMHKLSQMSWQEIKQCGRHQLGFEKISRNNIKSGIPSHVTEDVNFIAFRYCGMSAMVGYRSKEVFHVLWLDRDFTLYNHG